MVGTYRRSFCMTDFGRLKFLVPAVLLGLAGCVAPPQPFAPPWSEDLAEMPGVRALSLRVQGFANQTRVEYALTAALGAVDLPAAVDGSAPPGSHGLTVTSGPKTDRKSVV